MKRMMIMVMLTTIVVAARAMSFSEARQEAFFLSDKMAYELRLTSDQYEAVYEINLDYFLSIRYEEDVFGVYWNRRNTDLRFVLNSWQYREFITTPDFYQPAMWKQGRWYFTIYSRYDRGNHFRQPPRIYSSYRGGRNRGTISFYENRPINKPSNRHIDNRRDQWNRPQQNGGGNGNHFAQPGGGHNGQSGNVYNPGTNNRQNNTNSGTRKFGQGNSKGDNSKAHNTNNDKAKQSSTLGSRSASTTSNGSGHFGGQRK